MNEHTPLFRSVLKVAPAALLLALVGCAGPRGRVPDEHIVMVNYRGQPVDPTDHPWFGIGHYRTVKDPEFTEQLGRVFDHISEYAHGFQQEGGRAPGRPPRRGREELTDVSKSQARQEAVEMQSKDRGPGARPRAPKPRVVIFIHGGLNTQAGSVERAVKLHKRMLADGVYPVFVNWQSSLFSSYWDHLFLVRWGEESCKLAWLSAPFVIGADLFRALGRAPMTLWNEIDNAFNTASFHDEEKHSRGQAIAIAAEAEMAAHPAEAVKVEFPEAKSDSGGGWLTFARDVALAVPHMVLGVLLDIGGTSSWEEMHRRTTLIVEPEHSYRLRSIETRKPGAAVPRFLTELRELQDRLKAEGIDLEVDIICHSMGCIVSNLLLQTARSRDPDAETLPIFTNIVYMADADSVQRTERAVYSYLQGPQHRETKFFELSLNDRAEVAETTAFYLAPKGSLLVWIDRFFEATPSMPDQRAGKMQNQLFSIHRIPVELRKRVHMKSFLFESDDPRTNPTVHGDFSDARFWRPEFFRPRSGR